MGHEIDLIISKTEDLYPIEIKSGQTVNSNFFKNLSYYNNISKNKFKGAVIYGGKSKQKRQEGIVYSWELLKNLKSYSNK